MEGLQIFLDSDKVLEFCIYIPLVLFYLVQRKFFLASETPQRHVTKIVERDAREMAGLIEAAEAVGVGVRTLAQEYYPSFWEGLYKHMGRLSTSWSIFDQDVFLVSLQSQWSFPLMFH